jgi:hypothetical protein
MLAKEGGIVSVNKLFLNDNDKIYLDTCCFNRPFDNLDDDTVKLESDAVLMMIDRCVKNDA